MNDTSKKSKKSVCPVAHAGADPSGPSINYGSYLKVAELLELQQFESDPPAHDELLFITIHQAYELWFKQILFEFEALKAALKKDDLLESYRLLKRVLVIEELLVKQIHVLETMTPRDFFSFRRALNPASGFQSVQFRELEFISGLKAGGDVLKEMQIHQWERDRLQARLDAPSVRQLFYEMLARLGFDVLTPPDDAPADEPTRQRIFKGLLEVYRSPEAHPHLYNLCEALVSHDQNILLWRFHHVRVVERIIGTKPGTGGSSGVGYLSSTLQKRMYPLLWEIRGELDDVALYGTRRGG